MTKQVEAKESLLAEELLTLEKAQKELYETKMMLEKFNYRSKNLDEILEVDSKDPGK
ncbi:hypothetical protein J1N35_013881 [Gossypium stocksii]|uniref:Uncharacterized protein n=1 Tax=Gossypium stocksii TaxID=47602 RepID=A0A9D3VTP4_9ROSI|nr:hypothetical protein J1N35_013881 [Gossypium stocksii]